MGIEREKERERGREREVMILLLFFNNVAKMLLVIYFKTFVYINDSYVVFLII